MYRVLIVAVPEPGHILPTLSIAHHLVSHGCEVVYLTAPQFRGMVKTVGASLEPILPEDPRGIETSGYHIWTQFTPSGRHLRGKLLDKVIGALLSRRHFDLVLFDSLLATAYHCRLADMVEERRRLLFSVTLLNWKEHEQTTLDTPMMILCPEQLEIQKFRYPCSGLLYVEPSLRPTDEEAALNEQIDPDRPIVLAAFGTQNVRYRRLLEQCQMIEELARRQTKVQFVLAAGAAQKNLCEHSRMLPKNLFTYEKVPQRKLLERASAFISHGGLVSIKEAIMAGVPSIVLPVSHDQPFNAMRIRYHELGEAIFPEKQTLDAVESSVLAAMHGRYDAGLCAMQEIFGRLEAAKPSEALIQTYLSGF